MSTAERIRSLDIDLFGYIESQTTGHDRRSLLAIHDAVANSGSFSYLEIGSHLGGTLQAMLADPRCMRVVSIDPRPQWQPDDRPELDGWTYEDNSTERMLDQLARVPDADLSKLETVEASTENIAAGRFARPDFCFVDGEHTYAAALRDARFCRTVMHGAGVVAFHDFEIVQRAVVSFLQETARPHRGYRLRSGIYVVELGAGPTLLAHPAVRAQLHRPAAVWTAASRFKGDTLLTRLDIVRRSR